MAETFENIYECDVCQRSNVKVHSESSAKAAARALRGWLRIDCERVGVNPDHPAYRNTTLVCSKCAAGALVAPGELAAPYQYPEPAIDVVTAKGGAS